MTYLTQAEIPGLDPITMQAQGTSDALPGEAIFDLLVYAQGGVVRGQTAESLTSTDALVWTLKLRPGIKFTDGTPYDASAVKFNWQRLQDPANKAPQAPKANLIANMDVVDPLTLRLTLKSKNAVFPQAVVYIPFVGSPQAIQQLGDKFSSSPIGAGPFVLKQWIRDSQMVMQRNPNYWNSPLPYLDQYIVKPILDESQRLNTFCTGGSTIAISSLVDSATQIQKNNCGTVKSVIQNGGAELLMNVRKPPFNDMRVRQAVAMALDVDDIAKTVNNGALPAKHSIFQPQSPFYDSSIQQLAYDPVKAQQLFDQVAAETGGPITFTMITFTVAYFPAIAQYVQGKLNSYRNVKVQIDAQATASMITNSNQGNFQMANYAHLFDDPEPNWTGVFQCNAPGFTGYCNSKFDGYVTDNQTTLDPNKRISDIKEAQRIFYSEPPAFYTMDGPGFIFLNPSLQDVNIVNDKLFLIDRAWFKK